MDKHEACKDVCQQAVQYGVWPEHECDPQCVWLKCGGDPQNKPPTEHEKVQMKNFLDNYAGKKP